MFSYLPFSVFRICSYISCLIPDIGNLCFFSFVLFFLNLFIYLFNFLGLCWVFVSVRGLSPVVESEGHSSSQCAGLSLSRPLLLRSTGSRCAGSVVVAHGPSCSVACGIFPGQGPNPRPLHWQADSQPLRHQGSPSLSFLISLARGLSVLLILLKNHLLVSLIPSNIFLSSLLQLSALTFIMSFLLLALGLICSLSSFLECKFTSLI